MDDEHYDPEVTAALDLEFEEAVLELVEAMEERDYTVEHCRALARSVLQTPEKWGATVNPALPELYDAITQAGVTVEQCRDLAKAIMQAPLGWKVALVTPQSLDGVRLNRPKQGWQ